MARKYKYDESGLQVKWRTKQYYFDLFDADFFEQEMDTKECSHSVYYDNDEKELSEIKCVADIKGSEARLTYINQPEDVDEGVLIINFTSNERNQVASIDWMDSTGAVQKDDATSNWHLIEEAEEAKSRRREIDYLSRNQELVEARKLEDKFTCVVCDFRRSINGKYIIDVHHLYPLSEGKGTRVTNISDLVCLCPNCHRLAHTSRPPLTVKEMKEFLGQSELVVLK